MSLKILEAGGGSSCSVENHLTKDIARLGVDIGGQELLTLVLRETGDG